MSYPRSGFTLLECLTVLTIIAILSAITIPSLTLFLNNTKAQTASAQLLNAISLTRSEAMVRQENISLCGTANEIICSDAWQKSYMIKTSHDVLYLFQSLSSRDKLHWRSFPFHHSALTFLPNGLLNSENGTFWYCVHGEKNPAWAIMINQIGRARLAKPNAKGEIKDGKGKRFLC